MTALNARIDKPDALLTSHEAAELFQVNPSSINNWIRHGKLNAYRTPGGHRRIHARSLVSFAVRHRMPIPEALTGLSPISVVWADPDNANRDRVQKSLAKAEVELDFMLTASLADALLLVGERQPDLLVIDGRADDVVREAAVRVVQARYPEVGIVYVDHDLTENERRAAAALKVLSTSSRDEDPALVIQGIVRQ